MSTVVANFVTSNTSFPEAKANNSFTCLACEVVFPTSERQRNHYRTDWHKYNLKRKLANLSAVNAEQFTQKVLAQQERNRQIQEQHDLEFECVTCRKTYLTQNAYNNHITSKKHLELEQKKSTTVVTEEPSTTSKEEASTIQPVLDCLFCNHTSNNLESNLAHMTQKHSFFLPDAEYLKDTAGLISYLSTKINTHHLCLYCNGRGKELHSAAAARAHMADSGHCKMAYDESEDPEELLKYYDFGDLSHDEEHNTNEPVYGAKLVHRNDNRKRHHLSKNTVDESLSEENNSLESLRTRKERRHQLAITDGSKELDMKKTADGIQELTKKKAFGKKLSLKQNNNQLLRLRIQNPI